MSAHDDNDENDIRTAQEIFQEVLDSIECRCAHITEGCVDCGLKQAIDILKSVSPNCQMTTEELEDAIMADDQTAALIELNKKYDCPDGFGGITFETARNFDDILATIDPTDRIKSGGYWWAAYRFPDGNHGLFTYSQ